MKIPVSCADRRYCFECPERRGCKFRKEFYNNDFLMRLKAELHSPQRATALTLLVKSKVEVKSFAEYSED